MKVYSRRVYVVGGPVEGTVEVDGGRVVSLLPGRCPSDATDYGDLRIIPGIFDTHNHGTQGYSLMQEGVSPEGREATVRGYLKGLASQGTTNVFPTVCDLQGIFAVASVAKAGPSDGASVLGIHAEGPWLSRVGEKGVRTPWPEVSVDAARKMVDAAGGLLRLVALAPEIPGIDPVIDYFLGEGVTVAAAHSDNDYAQAMAAYAHGITVATHAGNVMTDMHHRDVGGLGAALLADGVDCEVICDGMHVCNEMLSIYLKVKSPRHFMMISDCTPFSGAPVGRYRGFLPDMEMEVTEEGFVLTDTGRLMGSSQPVLYGIGNLVDNVGVSLETCLEMACLNPARKYGFSERKGSIEVGKDADLVVISDDWQAQTTYVCGRKVYDRSTDGSVYNDGYLEENRL